MLNVFTDGAARGNPGSAAIAFLVTDENKNKIYSYGEKIGFTTNNVAEYKAVICALDWFCKNKEKIQKNSKIFFFLDSKLICSQLNGLFKIKDSDLRTLFFKVKEKEAELKHDIFYFHIPREQNKEADKIANMALDNKL